MIQATQLKRGMCIKHDNDLYRVVEAQHKTPGNLRGLVQAKIKSLKTAAISDNRFRHWAIGMEGVVALRRSEPLGRRGFLMSWAYVTDGRRGAHGCGGAIEVPPPLLD